MALSRIARAGCSTGCAAKLRQDVGRGVDQHPRYRCRRRPRSRIGCAPGRAACPDARRRSCGQLQFHCGKPPPAAEPSTRIFTRVGRHQPAVAGPRRLGVLPIGHVHRDFHAEPEIDGCGVSHFMMQGPLKSIRFATESLTAPRGHAEPEDHEWAGPDFHEPATGHRSRCYHRCR